MRRPARDVSSGWCEENCCVTKRALGRRASSLDESRPPICRRLKVKAPGTWQNRHFSATRRQNSVSSPIRRDSLNGPTSSKTERRMTAVDGMIGIRPMVTLTLSSDHRLIDGARAAQFMQEVVGTLSDPGKWLA